MMKESDLKYLNHLHYVLEETVENLEYVRNAKKEFIKEQEISWTRKGSRADGIARFKTYIERNPQSESAKRLKEYDHRHKHLVKEIDRQKNYIDDFSGSKQQS
jgi:hypothetical protein